MELMATAVGRLGSRFSLVFDPDAKQVLHSALGRWLDFPTDLAIGVKSEDEVVRALPFTRRFPHFEIVEQQLTFCGVKYVARSWDLGLAFKTELIAPFYPHDEWASVAPLFFIRLEVQPQERIFWRPADRVVRRGQVFVRLQRANLHLTQAHDRLKINYSVPKVLWKGERERPEDLGESEELWWCDERLVPISSNAELLDDGIAFQFDLDDPTKCRFDLVWCAFVDEPVLTVFGQPASFKYRWLFTDVEAVADFACRHFDELLAKANQMDELLSNSGLTKSQADLIRFSFQNFLLNTWWVVRDDGAEWFSVWEGSCHFHSTIDVEYNDALVYLAFFPELLELLLDEWALFEMQDEVGSYLAHDMGGELEVGRQAYHHPMPVEENANFLLMLHCLWRWTGKHELIERHSGLAKRLTAYFERSDTTGNGFPNLGTANTIDDASPAVQYSREQTYLAVKTLCACHAAVANR
jgi:Glycosyl hydrolase family 52.